MKSYRLNSVKLVSSDSIPVLLSCDRSKAEGVAIHVASEEEAEKLGRVRVIDSRALRLFTRDARKFRTEYGPVSASDRNRLIGLLLLIRAIRDKNQQTLTQAIDRLAGDDFFFARRALQKQPGVELARALAIGIRGVEFILWWKDDGKDLVQLSGLRCPNITTALYMLTVLNTEGRRGLGACVVCGQPFVSQRRTRKTCSGRCRYALCVGRKR